MFRRKIKIFILRVTYFIIVLIPNIAQEKTKRERERIGFIAIIA